MLARGTRFTAAYTASPICCPARASIATGRYPHETGYWDNAITYDGRVPTWHHRLREAGHEVALYDPFYFDEPAVLAQRHQFITCTEVVEHLHRPAEVFRTLHDMLEPGGWLAIMTSFQTDDSRFEHWGYRRDPTHVVFYREASFHHLARRLGYHPPAVVLD